MNEMYKYLQEHNYISRNKNKSPLRQQELSKERAEAIACKCENIIKEEKQELKDKQKQFAKYLEDIIDVYKEIDREFILSNKKRETKICKEILQEYREIIGGDNNE